jgi:hypothetical protein
MFESSASIPFDGFSSVGVKKELAKLLCCKSGGARFVGLALEREREKVMALIDD